MHFSSTSTASSIKGPVMSSSIKNPFWYCSHTPPGNEQVQCAFGSSEILSTFSTEYTQPSFPYRQYLPSLYSFPSDSFKPYWFRKYPFRREHEFLRGRFWNDNANRSVESDAYDFSDCGGKRSGLMRWGKMREVADISGWQVVTVL